MRMPLVLVLFGLLVSTIAAASSGADSDPDDSGAYVEASGQDPDVPPGLADDDTSEDTSGDETTTAQPATTTAATSETTTAHAPSCPHHHKHYHEYKPPCSCEKAYYEGVNRGKKSSFKIGYAKGKAEGVKEAQGEGRGENEAFVDGMKKGYAAGKAKGLKKGFAVGTAVGKRLAYKASFDQGLTDGEANGDAAGYQKGLTAALEQSDCKCAKCVFELKKKLAACRHGRRRSHTHHARKCHRHQQWHHRHAAPHTPSPIGHYQGYHPRGYDIHHYTIDTFQPVHGFPPLPQGVPHHYYRK